LNTISNSKYRLHSYIKRALRGSSRLYRLDINGELWNYYDYNIFKIYD
jgi:hypothetical protein